MSNGREFEKPCTYQVKVKGKLSAEWSSWFEDFSITPQPENETLLTGQIADQAALHGLLAKIASLGMPLLSVTRLEYSQENLETIVRKQGEHRNEYCD